MLKKILIALETLLLIAAVAFGIMTYMQKVKVIADRDLLLTNNARIQQELDAIGPLTNVFTVKTQMIAGTPVMAEDLMQMTIPASAVPADAITSLDQIKYVDGATGAQDFKYYKVTVNPFTMLTQDLLMNEDYSQPLYERDVYLSWLPVGLKANDCIDIRVSYPDGTDLVVFSHKRVYMVLDKVLKLKFSYGELVRYTSLLTEYEFYNSQGLGIRIYATAYIEPGLTKDNPASILYPLSEGASIMATRDPNIPDKNNYINENLRTYLDQKMKVYLTNQTEDFGIYSKSAMVTNESSALSSAMDNYEEMYVKLAQDESIEQPTDLTGTGWDGELVNGGVPYKNPTYSNTEEGAEGDLTGGLGTLPGSTGTESLGSLNSTMGTVQQGMNDSYDQLSGVANQLQEDPNSFPTVEQPTQSGNSESTGGIAPQETFPSFEETQATSESQAATVEETQATQESVASVETQPAADAQGNQQSITSESKEAARQSGNLFDIPPIS